MSKPKTPAAPASPAAPTDPVPTEAEIEAMVAAGEVTATVDGVEVEVVAIDLADAPPLEADASAAAAADGAEAPIRVRALIETATPLGAPGTIATQRADGSWYPAMPGEDAADA